MQSPMDESSATSGRALGLALSAALVLGVLYALYCMLLFAGPYRWLAELQLGWFKAYYVSTTCAFTLLLLVVPPSVALRVLAMSGKLPADSLAALFASPTTGARLRATIARARRWLIVLGAGVVLGGLSVRDLVVAQRGQTLERVSAAALETGAETHSTWLAIDGQLHWDSALEAEESNEEVTYVPIVSEAWTAERRLGALLMVAKRDLEELDASAISGTVDITGAPGMVRAAYEDMGFDASHAVLLEYGDSPAQKGASGKFLLGFGLFLMLIGGVGTFKRLR